MDANARKPITEDGIDPWAEMARLEALNAKLAAKLSAMWIAYGNNMERHAMNGDDTWTDEDHAEWQDVTGGVGSLLEAADGKPSPPPPPPTA